MENVKTNIITMVNVLDSIEKDPLSWNQWLAMHISINQINNIDKTNAKRLKESALSIISFYLDDVKGNVLFLNDSDVIILSKNCSVPILQEVGLHICDLYKAHYRRSVEHYIYDLEMDHSNFVYDVLSKMNNLEAVNLYDKKLVTSGKSKTLIEKVGLDWASLAKSREHKTVLLIEDDPISQRYVEKILSDKCIVQIASNAESGVEKYLDYQPDMVLLDIGLPDIDGKETLEIIRDIDPKAFVVMFSGKDDAENISHSLNKGAEGFIAKPCGRNALLYYLDSCTNHAA